MALLPQGMSRALAPYVRPAFTNPLGAVFKVSKQKKQAGLARGAYATGGTGANAKNQQGPPKNTKFGGNPFGG